MSFSPAGPGFRAPRHSRKASLNIHFFRGKDKTGAWGKPLTGKTGRKGVFSAAKNGGRGPGEVFFENSLKSIAREKNI
jgi:hypothetical protein